MERSPISNGGWWNQYPLYVPGRCPGPGCWYLITWRNRQGLFPPKNRAMHAKPSSWVCDMNISNFDMFSGSFVFTWYFIKSTIMYQYLNDFREQSRTFMKFVLNWNKMLHYTKQIPYMLMMLMTWRRPGPRVTVIRKINRYKYTNYEVTINTVIRDEFTVKYFELWIPIPSYR